MAYQPLYILTFPKSISTVWNVNSLIQDLNLGSQIYNVIQIRTD